MTEAVILDGLRTPIGKYRGSLAGVRPDDLAARTIEALLARQPEAREAVQEVIFGDTNQAGEDNRNVGRMSALLAGLQECVSATTVNRLCGSGAQAIVSAMQSLMLGDAEFAVAGGAESMSRSPYIVPQARWGAKMGDVTSLDMMLGALNCPGNKPSHPQK